MDELKQYLKRELGISDAQYKQMVEEEKQRIANPTYNYDGLELEDARELKRTEIYEACDKAINSYFESSLTHVDGENYEFYFDEKGQMRLNSQSNKINLYLNQLSLEHITQAEFETKFPIDWNTKNKGWTQLSYDAFNTIMDEAELHVRNNYMKRAELEAYLEVAADVDTIKGLVW
jgi:hypothetical protein